jgi:hypothetical protein
MRKITYSSAGLCLLAMAFAPAAATPQKPEPREIRDPDLRQMMAALTDDVEKARKEWAEAQIASDRAKESADATTARFQRVRDIRAKLGVSADLDEKHAQELVAAANQEATRLEGIASGKKEIYRTLVNSLQTFNGTVTRVEEGEKLTYSKQPEPAGPCAYDTPAALQKFDPNECRLAAIEKREPRVGHSQNTPAPGANASQTTTSLPGRVLDRRGITTQITGGSKDSVSIRLADTFNFRRVSGSGADFRQRIWSWGYSIGVEGKTEGGKARAFGRTEKESKRDAATGLDQLDTSLKLVGSFSFNVYPRETAETFDRRAATVFDDATAACRDDKKRKEPADKPVCDDMDVVRWIFVKDPETGKYLHPSNVEAYDAAFWGPHEKIARWGLGLKYELARPKFDYHPFPTIQVPDPLHPGLTTTVADTSAIPPTLAAKTPLTAGHLQYVLGGFAYYHFPLDKASERFPRLSRLGATLVMGLTYKHEYEAADDVTICAPATTPTTIQNCKTVKIADGTLTNTFVPSAELRLLFPGARFWSGRALIPEIGVAPKFTYDTDAGRYGIEVPFWFTTDDKGALSGGLIYARQWGGEKDGVARKSDSALSLFFGTTFSLAGGQ